MDIAAMSMAMSQSSVQQQASVSVMKKSMDAAETQMNALLEMMPSTPSFGHVLNTRA